MLTWIHSPRTVSERFLFVDRDGVINEDSPHYIKHCREFRFHPDALEALRFLRERSFHVILISNQSGLHRGIIPPGDFWDMHDLMARSIHEAGGSLLAAFYCPHRPDEACGCRKPSPGMILAAARAFRISLSRGLFLMGDHLHDIETAERAGCSGALIDRSPAPNGRFADVLSHPGTPRYSSLMTAVLDLPEIRKP